MSTASPASILIVDDQPANIKVLFELLQQSDFRVSVAKSGESALTKAEKNRPDLILLDVMMPGLNGYETCEQLKSNPNTQDIPVIFLSALDQSINKVKAFSIGGADYITKPFQAEEVLVRIQHQLELRAAKAKILELNNHLEQRIEERTAQLVAANESLAQEIAERERVEKQLRHGALHDALTELPNRVLFMEHLEHAQKRSHRVPDYEFAVLFIDLDRFKYINDTMGHQTGDKLLIQVAQRLRSLLRENDVLARLGGDEFIVLLDQIAGLESATQISERIVQAFQQPFDLNQSQVFTTASVGVALNSTISGNVIDLLRNADIAMYQAKGNGKARLQVFDQQMYEQTLSKHQLEKDLRQALDQQNFELFYQPIVCLKTQDIKGFETLIRWEHPQQGHISPSEFIPLAEEIGLISSIGEWVLHEACSQMVRWQTQFPEASSLLMSINLSMGQLQESSFAKQLEQILEATGLARHCLQIELTESMLMEDSDTLIELLGEWAKQGIQISIDDFGTGYSSLSYLHQFPIHSIKVDQSFTRAMFQQSEQRKIVETIISLAHQLGMTAIAEGIETQEHLVYLQKLKCEKGQGYYFSRPLPRPAVEELLSQKFSSPTTLHI